MVLMRWIGDKKHYELLINFLDKKHYELLINFLDKEHYELLINFPDKELQWSQGVSLQRGPSGKNFISVFLT